MNSTLSGGYLRSIVNNTTKATLSEDSLQSAAQSAVVAGVGSYLNSSGISNYQGGSLGGRSPPMPLNR